MTSRVIFSILVFLLLCCAFTFVLPYLFVVLRPSDQVPDLYETVDKIMGFGGGGFFYNIYV
jgi:hypothetical protein